tara:strand:- start:188 stop:820 length:633 start_codon:yes stop_codon:yes gene_type:complete
MNRDLLENNYIIINNFLSKENALELGLDFINYTKTLDEKDKGDTQVPKAFSVHCPKNGQDILYKKCDEVSNIVGCKLLPTYSYARVYEKENFLPIHKDRPACEVSLTVHLNGDTSWPFYIINPQGLPIELDLQPGDAVIYLGCVSHHWRLKYTGDKYAQVFLHYVREDGVYSEAAKTFDNKCPENFKKLKEEYINFLPTYSSYYLDTEKF